MALIIEPMISEKLDGQLHVLQKEKIIIIIAIRSNVTEKKQYNLQTLFGNLNNCDALRFMLIHSMLKEFERISTSSHFSYNLYFSSLYAHEHRCAIIPNIKAIFQLYHGTCKMDVQ